MLIAWYQHASGITFLNLERSPWTISYVSSIWMKDFIRLLRKYSIELKLQKKKIPTKQRHDDRCIMHVILSMIFSISIQKEINACRIHLQETFLSELTNTAGNRLSLSAFGENKRYRKEAICSGPNMVCMEK